jgi:hypothetical protein
MLGAVDQARNKRLKKLLLDSMAQFRVSHGSWSGFNEPRHSRMQVEQLQRGLRWRSKDLTRLWRTERSASKGASVGSQKGWRQHK